MFYQEFEPDKRLKEYIQYYWTLESKRNPDNVEFKVPPHGCFEIVFNYGSKIELLNNDNSEVIPRSVFVCQREKQLNLLVKKKIKILGIRFQPWSTLAFVNYNNNIKPTGIISLQEIFGEKAKLCEADIIKSADNKAKVDIINSFLLSIYSGNHSPNTHFKKAVSETVFSKGNIKVTDLTTDNAIGVRQLERVFLKEMGISPKKYLRIIRIIYTLKASGQNGSNKLTQTTLNANFYDQAHFSKEFKNFIGLTPSDYSSKEKVVKDKPTVLV